MKSYEGREIQRKVFWIDAFKTATGYADNKIEEADKALAALDSRFFIKKKEG